MTAEITYWDRERKEVAREPAYAGDFVRWCYETPSGRFWRDLFYSRRSFNFFYGRYKRSPRSLPQVDRDIARYGIDMTQFETASYRCYADFFLRRFAPGAREFAPDPRRLPAFAEGKYVGFERVHPAVQFPVKGQFLDQGGLLRDPAAAKDFAGGPMLICRLCPIDYHWFHYPDDGATTRTYRIPGRFHSVNVLALRNKGDVYFKNERVVSVLETRNFGLLAFIEVGAMCVGQIVQTHEATAFVRGEAKGYFMFGASTVILLGQPGRWTPDPDLVEQTLAGRETHLKLGEGVASAS